MGVTHLTIRKYRCVDLLVFTAIACILDGVIGRFGLFGGRQYFGLSTVLVLAMYVRWGKYALLSNLVVAAVNVAVNYVDLGVAFAHAAGILSLSAALFFLRYSPLSARRPKLGPLSLYYLFCYAILFFTEWLLLGLFGHPTGFAGFAANRIFDVLLGGGLLLLMAAQKELFIPMTPYLLENSEGTR